MGVRIPFSILAVLWTILISLSESEGQGCYFYQEMIMGEEYYIYNSKYPEYYRAGASCVWDLKTAAGTKIVLSCTDVSMPQSANCYGDKLAISPTGRQDFGDARNFCGNSSFSLLSQGTSLTVSLFSLPISYGGRFFCTTTAIKDKSMAEGPSQIVDNCDCGWKHMTRIIGGTETGINEFPFMAAIIFRRRVLCGSSIISERYALTAGHCVQEKSPTDIKLLVGDHNISSGSDTSYSALYDVNAYEIHPMYDPLNNKDDIAIIQTVFKIIFSLFVGPVCLPFRYTYQSFYGQKATELGWGQVEFTGPTSDTLLKVELTVISNLECAQNARENITTGEICTNSPEKDACQGDSGGPLIWMDTSTQRLQLVGIISHGLGCATDAPEINTRVTEYLNWIISRTSDASYCIK